MIVRAMLWLIVKSSINKMINAYTRQILNILKQMKTKR